MWQLVWVRRLAFLVLIWLGVWAAVRITTRLFDAIDRRMTEFGEPERRLGKIDFLVNTLLVILGIFLSLGALGLGGALWGALALTSIIGVVVGMAAQRIGQNLLAGIVILFERPFRVGDLVQSGDVMGHVTKVTLFATTVATQTGPLVMLPNNLMIDAPLKNLSSAEARRHRVFIDVVEPANFDRVAAALAKAVEREEHLVPGRPIVIAPYESLDDGVRWSIQYWVQRDPFILHCEPSAMRHILEELNAHKLATAIPTQRIHVVTDE